MISHTILPYPPHFWTKSCQTVPDLVKKYSKRDASDGSPVFLLVDFNNRLFNAFSRSRWNGKFFFSQYITWTSWRWDIHSWGSFLDRDPMWPLSNVPASAFGGCGAQFGDVAGHPSSLHLWPEIRGGDRDEMGRRWTKRAKGRSSCMVKPRYSTTVTGSNLKEQP